MSHFIQKCECGITLSQCRCPDPNKTVEIVRPCKHQTATSPTPQEPKKPVAYSRYNYPTYEDYEQRMRIWETAMGVYMANNNSQEVTEDNFGDPPQEPTAQEESSLETPFMTSLRKLGEKYYGNRLYGEHLNYQHELQQLIEAEAAKREQAARIDELERLISHPHRGGLNNTEVRATARIAELKSQGEQA